MAQFVESVAVIKISKLIKDGETCEELLNEDLITNITAILEELVGDQNTLVEVITTDK